MNYKISQGAFWSTEKAETLAECIKYRATANDIISHNIKSFVVFVNDKLTLDIATRYVCGVYTSGFLDIIVFSNGYTNRAKEYLEHHLSCYFHDKTITYKTI